MPEVLGQKSNSVKKKQVCQVVLAGIRETQAEKKILVFPPIRP